MSVFGRYDGMTSGRTDPVPPVDLDHTQCYDVIRRRDGRFDGRFITGVRTTGIFCRPSCPARTPAKANVEFFVTAAAAADAGYRACRRCRPELAPDDPEWHRSDHLVGSALDLLDHGVEPAEAARRLGVSDRHLRREFVAQLGTTPARVVRMRRLTTARLLLDQSDLSITDAAFAAGFGSLRAFNTAFREAFGASPSELRKRLARGGPAHLVLKLRSRGAFDGPALFGFLEARAIPGLEAGDPGSWTRRVPGGSMTLSADPGTDDHLLVRFELTETDALHDALRAARRLADLDSDVDAIGADLRRAPRLAPLVPGPAPRVPGAVGRFELCCRAILGQQVSVAGATTLLGRLVDRSTTGEVVGFPTPAAVAEADLDGLGMPTARIRTVQHLARAVADGGLDLDQPGPELERSLVDLPGIGPWTAGYVRMRTGDPDGWPSGDLVLRNHLGLDARTLDREAEAWRPWRAHAAMAIWRHPADPTTPAPDTTR